MTFRIISETRSLLVDAWKRYAGASRWIALQCIGLAFLIAVGVLWTRIPEKHVWQVLLTLLVPLLIAGTFLWLQGGTLRAMLLRADGDRTGSGIAVGSATLLLWIAIGWVLWMLMDRFDNNVEIWAGYLNSRFNADYRSNFATYEHFSLWLAKASWLLRWVVVPGLLLPLGVSAASGLRRIPWRRVSRMWINWRLWLMILILALVGEAWPTTFFNADPSGAVAAQIWRVALKLVAAYILAVLCWTAALAWMSTLSAGSLDRPDDAVAVEPTQLSPQKGSSDGAVLPLAKPEHDVAGNS